MNIFMVIVASGIARGRVRTTIRTSHDHDHDQDDGHTSNDETRILSLPCTSLIFDIHIMTNRHLSKQDIR